jgi:hypothetical protein
MDMRENTPETVPASEFIRKFGRYRLQAQRAPVPVSSHGAVTGYFIGLDDYDAFQRFRNARRSFATVDLPESTMEAIRNTQMDARHAPLDAMLDSD